MGFRFRKSKKILPGVRLNFSKSGVGVRVGGKHAGISVGSKGTRMSASIPGTGISYSTKLGGKKRGKSFAPPSQKRTKTGNTRPVPLRWWYILIAVVFLIGGIGCLFTDIVAAIFGILLGGGMGLGTALELRSEIKYLQINETEDTAPELEE